VLTWVWFSKANRWWTAILIFLITGALLSVFFLEDVRSVIFSWVGHFIEAVPLFWDGQFREGLAQLSSVSVEVSLTFNLFFDGLSRWWLDLLQGAAGYDRQITNLIWNFVIWLLGGWFSWAVRREWNAFGVVFPLVGVISLVVAYTKSKAWFLGVLIVACFAFVAFIQHYRREKRWEQQSISYSVDIRYDVFSLTLATSIVMMILILTIPSISVRNIVKAVQDFVAGEQEVDLAPAVGLYEVEENSIGEGIIKAAVPLLPVSHLVGSPPDLTGNVVMQVRANDPAFPYTVVKPYWRSHTYEEYTSRGWLVGEVMFEQVLAGEKLPVDISEDSKVYLIDFSLIKNVEQRLYFTGELITTDQEFDVYLRVPLEGFAEEDLYAGSIEAQNYQVEIAWRSYAASDLNTASEDYPGWISARYLQLPEDLPRRVIDLAKQITKDAETPYQQAAAIENYLRHYPYSLQVVRPPYNRDVVDFFLFDLKEGYCDYFATAMVVLSRAVGLPARLVVGYASGTYSLQDNHFQVTEGDAHSWAEVYFPEFGWVEFEPTSGRTSFDRENQEDVESATHSEFAFPSRRALFWRSFGTKFLYFSGGFILLVGLSLGGDLLNLQSKSPERMVQTLFSRLIWFAKRTKIPFRPSLTPYEFSEMYKFYLRESLLKGRFGIRMLPALEERLSYLTQQFVMAVYGVALLTQEDKKKMAEDWLRLLPFLVLTRMKTWFRRRSV
jgi:hypothetical protein